MALAIEFSPLLKWSIVEGLGERQKEKRGEKEKGERIFPEELNGSI